MATLLLDPAENAYLVDRLAQGGPPVFVQYGIGDGIVPNVTTERLAVLAQLPLVGPELSPVRPDLERIGSADIPADGRGMAQVFPLNSSAETAGFLAHTSFSEPAADVLMDRWLVNRLAAMGLGG